MSAKLPSIHDRTNTISSVTNIFNNNNENSNKSIAKQYSGKVMQAQPIQSKSPFRCTPPELCFIHCTAGTTYTKQIKLTNCDIIPHTVNIQQYNESTHKNHYFSLYRTPSTSDTNTNVASGMSLYYTVEFHTPYNIQQYCINLLCVTDVDQFMIPVIGNVTSLYNTIDNAEYKTNADIITNTPHNIQFNSCVVKYTSQQTFTLSASHHTPLRYKCYFDSEQSDLISIKPNIGIIQCNSVEQFIVYYTPQQCTMQPQHIILYMDLNGIQYTVPVTINNVGTISNSISLSEKNVILNTTYVTCTTQYVVYVYNQSNIPVQYKCLHPHPINELPHSYTQQYMNEYIDDTSDITQSIHQLSLNHPKHYNKCIEQLYSSKYLSIEAIQGTIQPNTHHELLLTYRPQVEESMVHHVGVDITGMDQLLELNIECNAVGSICKFSTDVLDITALHTVYINKQYEYKIQLINTSVIDAEWSVESELHELSYVTFIPDHGMLHAGAIQDITVCVNATHVGEFNELINCAIHNVVQPLQFNICGRVSGPTYECNINSIEYGTVSYGFLYTKQLCFTNTSDIPLIYQWHVQSDDQLNNKQFGIYIHNDHNRHELIAASTGTLQSHQSILIDIQYLPNQLDQLNTALQLGICGISNNVHTIPIVSYCVVGSISVGSTVLQYGTIWLQYKHTLQLILNNTSEYDTYFDVLPNHDDTDASITTDVTTHAIPANNTYTLSVHLTPHKLGSISVPLQLNIPGSNHCVVVQCSAQCVGAELYCIDNINNKQISKPSIHYSSINVLQQYIQPVVLYNNSPIDAVCCVNIHSAPSHKTNKTQPSTIFTVESTEFTVPPHTPYTLPVQCYATDTIEYRHQLHVTIQHGQSLVLPCIANATGHTIVSTIDLNTIEFPTSLTHTPNSIQFTLTNRGARQYTVEWLNVTHLDSNIDLMKYIQNTQLPSITSPIFHMTPVKHILQPNQSYTYTCAGVQNKSGCVNQHWIGRGLISDERKYILLYDTHIICRYIRPAFVLSTKVLQFDAVVDPMHPIQSIQQQLQLTNDTVLPVSCNIGTELPTMYTLSHTSLTLQPNESMVLYITFQPLSNEQLHTQQHNTLLTICYTNHKSCVDTVQLNGTMYYPNLSFNTQSVNFGTIPNNTSLYQQFHTVNHTIMSVSYQWQLMGRDVQYYDIQPIYGILNANEQQLFDVTFQPPSNSKTSCIAVCSVSDGPQYTIQLNGNSSSIQYNISCHQLVFDVLKTNQLTTKQFSVCNTGLLPMRCRLVAHCDVYSHIIQLRYNKSYVTVPPKQRHTYDIKLLCQQYIQCTFHFVLNIDQCEPNTIQCGINCMDPSINHLVTDNDAAVDDSELIPHDAVVNDAQIISNDKSTDQSINGMVSPIPPESFQHQSTSSISELLPVPTQPAPLMVDTAPVVQPANNKSNSISNKHKSRKPRTAVELIAAESIPTTESTVLDISSDITPAVIESTSAGKKDKSCQLNNSMIPSVEPIVNTTCEVTPLPPAAAATLSIPTTPSRPASSKKNDTNHKTNKKSIKKSIVSIEPLPQIDIKSLILTYQSTITKIRPNRPMIHNVYIQNENILDYGSLCIGMTNTQLDTITSYQSHYINTIQLHNTNTTDTVIHIALVHHITSMSNDELIDYESNHAARRKSRGKSDTTSNNHKKLVTDKKKDKLQQESMKHKLESELQWLQLRQHSVYHLPVTTMTIPSNATVTIPIYALPQSNDIYCNTVRISMEQCNDTIDINVRCRGVIPDVAVSHNTIEFDSLVLGQQQCKLLSINNPSDIPVVWSLHSHQLVELIQNHSMLIHIYTDEVVDETIQCSVTDGTIQPNTTLKLLFTYVPNCIMDYKHMGIQLKFNETTGLSLWNQQYDIQLTAISYTIQPTITYTNNQSSLDYGTIYTNRSKSLTLAMTHTSVYPCTYYIKCKSKQLMNCMQFSTDTGILPPNTTHTITATFTSTRIIELVMNHEFSIEYWNIGYRPYCVTAIPLLINVNCIQCSYTIQLLDSLPAPPTSFHINFNAVSLNDTIQPRVIRISNMNSIPMNVGLYDTIAPNDAHTLIDTYVTTHTSSTLSIPIKTNKNDKRKSGMKSTTEQMNGITLCNNIFTVDKSIVAIQPGESIELMVRCNTTTLGEYMTNLLLYVPYGVSHTVQLQCNIVKPGITIDIQSLLPGVTQVGTRSDHVPTGWYCIDNNTYYYSNTIVYTQQFTAQLKSIVSDIQFGRQQSITLVNPYPVPCTVELTQQSINNNHKPTTATKSMKSNQKSIDKPQTSTNDSVFQLSHTSVTLQPYSQQSISIQFVPVATQQYNNVIQLTINDECVTQLNLCGTGIPPPINVLYNNVSIDTVECSSLFVSSCKPQYNQKQSRTLELNNTTKDNIGVRFDPLCNTPSYDYSTRGGLIQLQPNISRSLVLTYQPRSMQPGIDYQVIRLTLLTQPEHTQYILLSGTTYTQDIMLHNTQLHWFSNIPTTQHKFVTHSIQLIHGHANTIQLVNHSNSAVYRYIWSIQPTNDINKKKRLPSPSITKRPVKSNTHDNHMNNTAGNELIIQPLIGHLLPNSEQIITISHSSRPSGQQSIATLHIQAIQLIHHSIQWSQSINGPTEPVYTVIPVEQQRIDDCALHINT